MSRTIISPLIAFKNEMDILSKRNCNATSINLFSNVVCMCVYSGFKSHLMEKKLFLHVGTERINRYINYEFNFNIWSSLLVYKYLSRYISSYYGKLMLFKQTELSMAGCSHLNLTTISIVYIIVFLLYLNFVEML